MNMCGKQNSYWRRLRVGENDAWSGWGIIERANSFMKISFDTDYNLIRRRGGGGKRTIRQLRRRRREGRP